MKKIRASIEVLSQDEIELIHKSTLRILENVGVKVPNAEVLDACENAGAIVDKNSCVVKIPSRLMNEILSEVKKNAAPAHEEDKVQNLKGNISTQVFIVDHMTQTRRYGEMDDVVKGIVLADRLQNISASNAVVVPHDVPYSMSDILSHQAIYSYSTKPGGTYILSPVSAKYIIQMSDVVGLPSGYFLETISPLQFAKESLEMAMVYTRLGKHIGVGPMVVGGSTGPVTLAGTVTLQNAEILASIFIVYTINRDYGYYGSYNHTMDLKTTLCSFGSPNQAMLGMAAAQLGRHYGMGVASNSGMTDAILPDFQGGFEKASTGILSCLAGAGNIGAQGLVGADQGVSFEQLVIDNEWLDAYNYMLRGIEVNEDTVAVDVIESVGIGGNFISEEHTVEYMRDNYWSSNLFNRDNWEGWLSKGSKQILDRAHEHVLTTLDRHYPPQPVIEQSKLDELNYIVKCAGDELSRSK